VSDEDNGTEDNEFTSVDLNALTNAVRPSFVSHFYGVHPYAFTIKNPGLWIQVGRDVKLHLKWFDRVTVGNAGKSYVHRRDGVVYEVTHAEGEAVQRHVAEWRAYVEVTMPRPKFEVRSNRIADTFRARNEPVFRSFLLPYKYRLDDV
jgi:hypothetical protein